MEYLKAYWVAMHRVLKKRKVRRDGFCCNETGQAGVGRTSGADSQDQNHPILQECEKS